MRTTNLKKNKFHILTNNFNYVIIKVINKQFGFSKNHIFFGKKCCFQIVPFSWSLPIFRYLIQKPIKKILEEKRLLEENLQPTH
ncbi:hypothetical protein PA0062 [Candidatus Phytoplasma australiense]|uniref:Uncharacterized protein n=1 Tax=Phytoplasma australiense TaxID=59748 RepID=B1V8R9_PHYAS|nr:hypothetical protein PA0062 [Candidatus Phytoplasma australiense]